MDVVIEFIKSVFDFLIANYALYLVVVMGVLMTIIYFILAFIKKPIKKLTGKIQNEQLRHLANKIIIIMSFGFSALLWLVLHCCIPKYFAFNGVEVLITGAFPIVLYAFTDGLTKPKAKEIIDEIKAIVNDGEVKEEEIRQLVDKMDVSTTLSAENELDKLLK